MRIYLLGSHSVGKSTLARYISKHYNLPMLPEVARMVLSEKELQLSSLRSDIDIVDEYQNDVFNRQISEEKRYKEFVADRSAIDCIAYSAQHSRIASELIKSDEIKIYVKNLHTHPIFFVRPSKATLYNDGVRENINWDGIIAIDSMIKLLLEMFDLTYFQINTDSMQERIAIIDAVMNRF